MLNRAKLKSFLYNWELRSTEDFPGIYRVTEPSCYEVIRLMGGVPLFLDEHYDRLVATAASIGQRIPFSLEEFKGHIIHLARENGVEDYNIKLVINDFDHGGTTYLFFAATSYPTEEMYAKGVATDLLRTMRPNPQAKIINQSLRSVADALMEEKGLYEAVLVNEDGEITEGSRSNLFFIRGDTLVTSPPQGVLLGVTRQRILRLAVAEGIPVSEEDVPVSSLESFSAAFISGTSPKVLPIANIGDLDYDVNDPVLRRVMDLYDREIHRSLGW